MGRVQIFHATLDGARELGETPFRNEKELQGLVETHLHNLTGIDFVATEHRTGSRHKRRADTLGLDSQQRPVVIEYKLGHGGAAISQGLDYLYWLEDHKGDFRELVRNSLGSSRSRNIDFRNARLLCVAGWFRREDVINAETNRRRIDLLSVRRHGAATILLEWVHGKEPEPIAVPHPPYPDPNPQFPDYGEWDQLVADKSLYELFKELCDFTKALNEELWVKPHTTGFSIKLKPGKRANLLYIWPSLKERLLTIQLKLDLTTVSLEEGFTQDISQVERHRPYTLLVFIRNHDDLKRAKPLIRRSYEEAG